MIRTPLLPLLPLFFIPSLLAQVVPAPSLPSAPEEVIELSPFEVNSSRDVGYQADNTLAGSRLDTRLRDTAASVSVFTREFIDDLGITNLAQLVEYSVNTEISIAANADNQNAFLSSGNLNNSIRTRGIAANQGLDGFLSIAPADVYRVSRFDDSRGPNSILFGIGSAGGFLNQSSKAAVTARDFSTVRLTGSSWSGHRVELDVNRLIVPRRVALEVAGVHQSFGGWRDFDFRDRRRVFGAVTVRPLERVTIKAMIEVGRDENAIMRTLTDAEEMLAWYDHRGASGVDAVTYTPTTSNVTPAMIALGATSRNGSVGGTNHRAIYLENTGSFFDAIGTYLTGTYNNAAVRAPDGTPGRTGGVLRIHDPAFYPYHLNAAGPGMTRTQSLRNQTVTIDWQATRRLFFNLGYNHQETDALLYLMTGANPVLRGDPNRTLGIGGPANPHVGRLYFDGDWNRDWHARTYAETRLLGSYNWEPRWKWLGRHRFLGLAARSRDDDASLQSSLVLAGRPFNPDPSNANNRIVVRNYLTEGNYGTYRAGDWRSVPAEVTFLGRTYRTVWANPPGGSNNTGARQDTDTFLGVLQSHLLGERLVTTLGYREDRATLYEAGFSNDPILGDVVDWDPAKRKRNKLTGWSQTAGAVFHLTDWVSLLANRSSSIGLPSYTRTVFPLGELAGPPEGQGRDYGLNFTLLGERVNAKVVYYEVASRGAAGAGGAPASFNVRNLRIMDAFASVLMGADRPFTTAAWAPVYKTYTPPVSGTLSDTDSSGWEARLTANLRPNWRLVLNLSKTDAAQTNLHQDAIPWYGFKVGADGLMVQGVRQDPATGLYSIDPNAYVAGGAIARWIELGRLSPAADPSRLQTAGVNPPATIAQEIFNLTSEVNQRKQEQEQRWGLRPYQVNFFTAYDFKSGWSKGLSLGAGWRWRSANIIGNNTDGRERPGRALSSADLMVRYALKMSHAGGRLSLQLNASNLLGRSGIIPIRMLTDEPYDIPGGRGPAYTRFDLIDPREWRFSTVWEF